MSYTSQQQTALRMIRSRGVKTTLTRETQASVDEVRDVATGGGPESQLVVVVVFPASEGRDLTRDEQSNRRKNRRKIMIGGLSPSGAALAFEPDDEQTIKVEGGAWTLEGVSRFAPDAGPAIYYDAEIRR